MSSNLAELLLNQGAALPQLRLGVLDDVIDLDTALTSARKVAAALLSVGCVPGARVALVEQPDTNYLVFWMGCQLAGVSPALINPSYPLDLVESMLDDLDPVCVVASSDRQMPGSRLRIDLSAARHGRLTVDNVVVDQPSMTVLPGLSRAPLDIAGYMHTSGTTGAPKFCAQSHEYFLRLGKYAGDALSLTRSDVVFAPLPFFHINPLGYGFLGGLTHGADVIGLRRFVPEEFWAAAISIGATVLVMHAPPVNALIERSDPAAAIGHRVRITFYADLEFLRRFGIPRGVSAYGSTEAGGLTHTWHWSHLDQAPPDLTEGVSHYGGASRDDIEWRLDSGGEIVLRARSAGAIFAGYWRNGKLDTAVDADGWFHTGDLGRADQIGNLVFIERASDSIRVRGEFIPIDYVESQLRRLPGITDLALWKEPRATADDVPVLYVAGESIPVDRICAVISRLPRFMRPLRLIRVTHIPRDTAAGKVRRRLLPALPVAQSWPIETLTKPS